MAHLFITWGKFSLIIGDLIPETFQECCPWFNYAKYKKATSVFRQYRVFNAVSKLKWPWLSAMWRHRSWSTLIQIMACCLMDQSHNLNLSSETSSYIHLRTISQEIPQPSITKTTYHTSHSIHRGPLINSYRRMRAIYSAMGLLPDK